MSAELDELLKLLAKIEKEAQPPPGPIVLTSEYLRLVERVEALPRNRPGAVREAHEASYRLWDEHYARARRLR